MRPDAAAIVSFTTDDYEGKQPKDITGLELYAEDNNNYHFRFDPVLESSKDSYEVQRSMKAKKGKTYYYRVRSYTYNDCGTKTYSAWSKVKKVKLK